MKKNKKAPILTDEKAKDFKKTSIRLLKTLAQYKTSLILILIFTIASTVFIVIGPKILGNVTTEIFNGIVSKLSGGAGINYSKIGVILIILLALYLVATIFSYIEGVLMAKISQKYTFELREKVTKKLNKLPMNYFDKKSHGDILSVVTNDIDVLSQNLNQSATEIIRLFIIIIFTIIMMLTINFTMTVISLILIPLSSFFMMIIMKKSQKYFVNQQNYLGKVNADIEEMYSGHMVIKAFNAEETMLEKFAEDNFLLSESAAKSQFLSGLMQPIMTFIANFGYVILAVVGGNYVIKGIITVGNIQAFLTYSKQFTSPIAQLAQQANAIQTMIAAAERVFEILDAKEEKKDKVKKQKELKLTGNVEFKNVKFGYEKNNYVINDFSLKVKKGQKIAIVGKTGAGKTTIVKLLMNFYPINSGKIFIDNKNINSYNKTQLRKELGMVLQDTWLFNGTIMENLRYGKLDATDDEVIEAAKTAHVHHFIQTLPNAYQMQINEDTSNISEGQKQLLTIARAILSNPKILILDEATSSVDTRTEILIQKAMDELMKGRTSFIIAHRLSTIKNADLILVMDDGDIVETGTHNQLIKKKGPYAELYNSQFESVA